MELREVAGAEPAVTSIFVIQLEGEFDLAERDRLKDAFGVAHTSATVVVNLGKTTYIDSTVLGCLVELRNATLRRGASLFLVGLDRQVRKLFEITSLDEIFNVRSRLSDVPDVDVAEIRRLTIEARPVR
jgi:anti-sigma B factor antagonist